ncbi:MAG: hypothetical protein ACOX5X_00015 [Acholeplasmataceae bacterium]
MKILVIFIMITCLSFLIKFLVNTIKPPEVIKGVVVEVYENRSNLILKSKNIKFLVKTKEKYKVGDVLIISGDIKNQKEQESLLVLIIAIIFYRIIYCMKFLIA